MYRQLPSNYAHEQDRFFKPGLACNVQAYADTYEMKNALHILDEARRPVELSESRQETGCSLYNNNNNNHRGADLLHRSAKNINIEEGWLQLIKIN